MSGYTKGLWEATTSEATMNDRSEWYIGPRSKPHVVRGVMSAADARLLAAAPRLAEALKELVDMKHMKEMGMTTREQESYNERKPRAWNNARAALQEAGIE